MDTRPLLRADILATRRLMNYRINKHIFLSTLIIIAVVGLALLIVYGLISVLESGQGIDIARWEVVLLIFGIMLARSSMYTYSRFLKSRELQYVMSMQISFRELTYNRLKLNITLLGTLFILSLALFWTAVAWAGYNGAGPGTLPPRLIYELVVLFFAAIIFGMTIPVKAQVRPKKRAMFLLIPEVYSGALLFFIAPYSGEGIAPSWFYLVLLTAMLIIAVESLLITIPLTGNAWARQTMKMGDPKPNFVPKRIGRLGRRFWGPKVSSLISKELKVLVREKEFIGNLLVSISIIVILAITFLYFPLEIGGEDSSKYQYTVIPLLIGLSLFIIALLMGALTALAMVGIEGKATWNIKVLPLLDWEVMRAKATASYILGLPLIIGASCLILLDSSYPLEDVVFLIIEGNAFLLAFIGLGIWGSAAFPNFDSLEHGMPDILIQLGMVVLSFIVAVFIGGIPAFLMNSNHLVGLVASFFALLISMVMFDRGIAAGARRYARIDSSQYMGHA